LIKGVYRFELSKSGLIFTGHPTQVQLYAMFLILQLLMLLNFCLIKIKEIKN